MSDLIKEFLIKFSASVVLDGHRRSAPFQVGYRPNLAVAGRDYFFVSQVHRIDPPGLDHGQSGQLEIWAIAPEGDETLFSPETQITINEASRVIGHGSIIAVLAKDVIDQPRPMTPEART